MPKQAALILPKPDWIQLTNVHRKRQKHKDMLLLTKTTIAGETLDGIEKVVVVGHGHEAPNVMDDITPVELVGLISKTNFKRGKLRLDTCYSAYNDKDAAAPLVAAELKKKNLNGIVVSGTVGPSITGWDAKRGVVPNDDYALTVMKAVEGALKILHEAELTEAGKSAQKWDEGSSSEEIAKLASEVAANTQRFFSDYLKVMSSPKFPILQRQDQKAYFDPAV